MQQEYEPMTDWEVMADINVPLPHVISPIEMNRRLKVAITDLTGELTSFRRSSEGLIRDLTRELKDFRESSDNLAGKVVVGTRWLVRFTAALVILTIVLVILTIVLIVQAPHGGNTGPASPATPGPASHAPASTSPLPSPGLSSNSTPSP
jgi:hypothetical protein